MRARTAAIVAAAVLLGGGVGYLLWGQRLAPAETATATATATPPATATQNATATGNANPGAVGAIEGTVEFTGKPPAPATLHREADPFCAKTSMTDPSLLLRDGRIANVWIHVAGGAPDSPPPAQPLQITQR